MSGQSMKPISEAAGIVGVSRKTLATWVRAGKLAATDGPMVGNLRTRLVSVPQARRLAAVKHAGWPSGKPRKVG